MRVISLSVVTVPSVTSFLPTPHVSLATRPKTIAFPAVLEPETIAIPPLELEEAEPDPRRITGSSTFKLVVSSVTVVPLTVKSPAIVRSPDILTPSSESVVSISRIPALPAESNERAELLLSIRSKSTAWPVPSTSPPSANLPASVVLRSDA